MKRRRTRSRDRRRGRLRRRQWRGRDAAGRARSVLRGFRQASILAVAVTAFILLLVSDGAAQPTETAAVASSASDEVRDLSVAEAAEEAVGSVRSVLAAFQRSAPKFGIALGLLALGWLVARVVRKVVCVITSGWERSQAISALGGIVVWFIAIAIAASVLVGDLRAVVGSLGLIGLALSWALQTPIESFTGWLLNSFQGYYRVGDRVAVGEVFGDVVKIDFLTTTVWEVGTPQKPGFVPAEQPTGRVVTFPNSEVLTGMIMNLTRDFPYVWDELPVAVANESDLRHAMTILDHTTRDLLGEMMREPAEAYRKILWQAGLTEPIATGPQVFAAPADSWTDLSIRYLVPARERRKWKSELAVRVAEVMARPEHAQRVFTPYPRRQLQPIGPDGRAVEWGGAEPRGPKPTSG